MKVAIIGAGATGLSAAHFLASRGDRVTIFEADEQAGGLCRSFDFAGIRLEKFYHHGFTADTQLVKFADDMGLSGRLKWATPNNAFVMENGSVLPLNTPVDLLNFKQLSWSARIRLGLMIKKASKIRDWKRLENITAEDWVCEDKVGWEIWEKIWGPLVRSKFGASADKISAVWLWNKIASRSASRKGALASNKELLCYMEGGFGELWSEAARRLEKAGSKVLFGCCVNRIEPVEGGGFNVLFLDMKDDTQHTDDFDAVLYTGAPHLLPDMVRLPSVGTRALIRGQYMSNLCLCLHLKKSLSPHYWTSVAQSTCPFVAVIEHSNILENKSPYGEAIVYLSKYLSPTDHMMAADDEHITDIFLTYLRRLYPTFFKEHVLDSKLFREIYAQPVVTAGYQVPGIYTAERGLFVANMSNIYPKDRGQNQAIILGREVAKEMRLILT